MTFNRFEVRVPQTSIELEKLLKPNDDLVKLRCFSHDELNAFSKFLEVKNFSRKWVTLTSTWRWVS